MPGGAPGGPGDRADRGDRGLRLLEVPGGARAMQKLCQVRDDRGCHGSLRISKDF